MLRNLVCTRGGTTTLHTNGRRPTRDRAPPGSPLPMAERKDLLVSKVPPDPCPPDGKGAGRTTHPSQRRGSRGATLRDWAAVLLAATALTTAVAAGFKTIVTTVVDTLMTVFS